MSGAQIRPGCGRWRGDGPTEGPSLLDQAIAATKQTEPDRAELLLRTLTEEALSGTVTYSRNLTITINKAIAMLDAKMSRQLAAIMHSPEFVKLEGSWRGLNHLVMNSETSANLKIRVLNVSPRRNWAAIWRRPPSSTRA